MPEKTKELSALAVSKIKQDGRYAVGGISGVYQRVASQSRSWVFRIIFDAKRHDIGLGGYHENNSDRGFPCAGFAEMPLEITTGQFF